MLESAQGLSTSRNLGVDRSKGDLIAFTDDDVDLHPEWLANLITAQRGNQEQDSGGGRIIPKWANEPPRWLLSHSSGILRGVTMDFTLGECARFLSEEECFFGANMAFDGQF